MTSRGRTSLPTIQTSSTRRSRRSIHDNDHNDDIRTIPDNFHDCREDYSESDDEPLRRPFRNAVDMHSSNDPFTSPRVKQVVATQVTHTLALSLHRGCQEVSIVPWEEDECEPTMLASKKVSDSAF